MAIKSFLSEGGFSVGSVGSTPVDVIDASGNITAGTISGSNLTLSGNLTVNGTTVTLNSTTTTLDDPIFTLGGDTVPTSDDNKDRGIEFRWHNGTAAKVGFFGYDDSTGKFVFIPDATNTSEVFSGTKGTIDANLEWADVLSKPSPVVTVTLTGDVTGTANTTLTSLGNGTITISTTVAADSVALGTDTTGNYVASITNGSYITGGNGGSEAAALTLAVDATSANTASKVVARDASGNFSAGTITAAGGVIASGQTANSWLFEARGTAVTGGFSQYGNNIKSVQYWNASNTISVGSSYSANVANDGDLIVSGKIGVGTLSPGGKLEVNFTAATAATAVILRTSDSGANGAIRWQNSGGTNQAGIGSNFNVSDVGALEFLNGTTTNVIFRSSGSVGIGITAPEAALHVAKTGADEQLILGSAATNRDISMAMYSGTTKAEVLRFQSAFRLMHGASNSITQQSFFTSGGERLTIVSGGNIGIGTASPGAKLHIAGPHADESADRAATTALIVDTRTDGNGDGKTYIKTGWVNSGNYGVSTLAVGYYSASRQVRDVITMLGTGSVGVGVSSPSAKLHVSEASGVGNFAALKLTNTVTSVNANVDIIMEAGGQVGARIRAIAPGASHNDLAMYVTNSGTLQATPAIFIQGSTNRVGINRSDPSNTLDVNGSVRTTDWYYVENSGNGMYNNANAMWWASHGSGSYSLSSNTTFSGIKLFSGGSQNTFRGHFYGDADGQGFLNSAGNWSLRLDSSSRLIAYSGIANMNAGIRISMPGGAAYSTQLSTVTGAFKIKLPTGRYKTDTMLRMTIKIYQYSTGQSLTFNVGGYNYNHATNTWLNVFAEQESDSNATVYTVRFGDDGTSNCIWIGETNSTWSYPQVFVSEFEAGYSGTTIDWASGWTISAVTAFDTVYASRTSAVKVTSNNIGTYGVSSITGTSNQVIASASTGAVTLSLPQNIHTSATPTFGGGTLNGTLTVVKSNGGNVNGSANAAIYLSQDESSIQGPGTNTVIRMGGNLVLGANSTWIAATNGTTAITVNNSQNATFAGSLTVSGGSTTVDSGSSGIVTVGYATALSSSNQGNSAIGVVGRNLRASSTNDDLLILKTNAAIGAQGVVFKTGTIELYAVSGSVTAGNVLSSGLAATFTTATSTIAGNLAVNGGTGTIDATSGTASATLNLVGRSSGTAKTASIASNSAGSLLLSAEGAGSALGIAANTGNTTVAYNLTVNGTGKQTLGQSVNATVYAGNTSTTDQAIILSNTRRANYGDVMIAKNLEGVASADSYATPATSAATGYAAVEMRYGGVVRVYGNSGATTAAAVVAPNVLAEFTPTAIGLNLNTTVTGNLTVSGNLIINGTTTTVNSTTTTLDDPIITLGGDTAPTVDDNKDRGVEFRWHNGTAAKVGFFGYDDSSGYFTFIPDATNTSEVFSGTKGTIDANLVGNVTGNVSGSAGSLVGTLTAGAYLTGGSFNGSTNVTFAVDATSANTASKVVARDANGSFSAGASNFIGPATTTAYALRVAKGNYADSGGHTTFLGFGAETTSWSKGAIGWTRTGSYDTGQLGFFINSAAADTTSAATSDLKMVILGNGNVGIGLAFGTAPGYKLEVSGNGYFSGALSSGGTITASSFSGSLANTLTLNTSGTGLSGSATYNNSGAVTFTVTSNATSANTASTIVARDASGNFTAGTITAALSGNASTATTLQTARNIAGVSFNGSADISITGQNITTNVATAANDLEVAKYLRWKNYGNGHVLIDASQGTAPTGATIDKYTAGQTITNAGAGSNTWGEAISLMGWNGTTTYGVRVDRARTIDNQANSATTTAATANTASTIVLRDASGNFSAGTITATLAGLATSETLSTVTGRGASTSSQISVSTSAGGSMFTGTKSGSGYSDGVSGATFKSILDNPNGGAGFAFVSYYNASGGTIGASIRADGFTTLTYNPVASLANNTFSITTGNYGSLHFDNGEGTTGNARQTGITWRGGSTNVVQAGIYVSQNSATGTTMALATTDNYSTGPQIGMTISTTGVVNFPRNRPTYAGNVILDAANYGAYSTFSGIVTSTSGGFQTATYASNARNRIWSFGNADAYGLSYFQGSAGFAGTTVDTIGIHFGTATAAASQFRFNQDGTFNSSGAITQAGNQVLHAGNYTTYVGNGTLTLAVSGTGLSGSASFTANQSGNSTFTVTSNATSANTGGAIVARDANGDFNSRNITLTGSLNAVTKSFVIKHPTKEGKKLRYGSLEGPENGVYVRGKLKGSNIIELPDYWTKLVDPESITVQLTPIGSHQKLYVEKIEDNKVYIANENLLSKAINCFFYVLAERCDVEKLEVEIDA